MSTPLSPGQNITVPDILSLPRPSTPIVNPSSTKALWPTSRFYFNDDREKPESSKTVKWFGLVDLTQEKESSKDGGGDYEEPRKVLEGVENLEAAWLDDETFIYLKKSDEGEGKGTEVHAYNIETNEEYLLGQFPVTISDIKTLQIPSSSSSSSHHPSTATCILSFSSLVYPDGSIYTVNEQDRQFKIDQQGSDVLVYDDLFVRHWDEWRPTKGQKKQLFFVRLSKNSNDFGGLKDLDSEGSSEGSEDGFEIVGDEKWSFEMNESEEEEEQEEEEEDGGKEKDIEGEKVKNLLLRRRQPKVYSPLAGTPYECPVGPFGSSSDYTLSPTHLSFHSKDPHVSPAWHTRTNVYIVPLSPRHSEDSKPRLVSIGTTGGCSSPVFEPKEGNKLCWLEMKEDGYEADKNRIVLYDLERNTRKELVRDWDRSPSKIEWSRDGERLYFVTEERGHVKLFCLDLNKDDDKEKEEEEDEEPRALTERHTVSSAVPLENGNVLVSINSFTHPNELSILSNIILKKNENDKNPKPILLKPLASYSRHLLKDKLVDAGEEFVFSGSQGREVHGWILFPPQHQKHSSSSSSCTRKEGKKYPMAFVCHGGPQSAWNDGWSTRWNLNAYAGKGYVTVAINRTGSTGFGQKFCDSIKNDWGGAPFRDLVSGVEFVQRTYPEIDRDRMASLGASYGGFMQNWIQGHNDVMKFKCLVCHDGVFSLAQTYYSTEELYFPTREFGGAPWEVPENYERFNPQNHIKNWKTPQLVIHGSKDYRLVEGEGLGVFNTLQRLGIPSRLLIFPSENHWVLSPQNSAKWHEEVFKWIGEWTSTPSSPQSSTEE